MSRQKVTRVSPSGRAFTMSWSGDHVVSHVSGVHFVGGSYGRAFQVAPAGAHDFAAEHLYLGADLVSRDRMGRYELRVSRAKDGSATFASLIGQHHELMTVFSGPAPKASAIRELFAVLDVKDSANGMTVTPQNETGLTVSGEHVFVQCADSTSIDVPAPQFARDMLPKRAGQRTSQGEVWRSQLPGRSGKTVHDFSYTIGTDRGVAEVVFADASVISESAALAVLDSIDIAWA